MAKGKYAKYINEIYHPENIKWEPEGLSRNSFIFDKWVFEETTHFIEIFAVVGTGAFGINKTYGTAIGGRQINDEPNAHDTEEMFLFLGTDPDNPRDLGGEVEVWLGEGEEAEKYIITKPSMVFIPKGLVHCPVVFRKVDRPIILIEILNAPEMIIDGVDAFPPGYKL